MSDIIHHGGFIMFIKASEKGQALVLIVLAAIGLFAFAALAIDGSIVFSDKRHAQNAADTAALASSLAYVRGNNFEAAAQTRATENGYDNGTMSDVTITTAVSPQAQANAPVTSQERKLRLRSYRM